MILLDTNIVSELYRPQPSAFVLTWLDRQSRDILYLCTPVLAEMHFGVALLDSGPRKDRLRTTINRIENELYRDRILVFDAPSAAEYGRIAALRQKAGRIMGRLDGLIAAIALANNATLATRNTRDFTDLGLDVIDPFEADVDR
jgi:predicted nucleic acid-binding protein